MYVPQSMGCYGGGSPCSCLHRHERFEEARAVTCMMILTMSPDYLFSIWTDYYLSVYHSLFVVLGMDRSNLLCYNKVRVALTIPYLGNSRFSGLSSKSP